MEESKSHFPENSLFTRKRPITTGGSETKDESDVKRKRLPKPYLIITASNTRSNKTSLIQSTKEYLDIQDDAFIKISVDELVQNHPLYKEKVKQILAKIKRLSEEEKKPESFYYLNPSEELYQEFSDAYKTVSTSKNCMNVNLEWDCNDLSMHYLKEAVQQKKNIIFEYTGSYIPSWLLSTDILSDDYIIVFSASVVNLENLVWRNNNMREYTALLQFERDEASPAPTLPNVSRGKLKKDLKQFRSILFEFFNQCVSHHNVALCGNRQVAKLLVFDNNGLQFNSEEMVPIFDSSKNAPVDFYSIRGSFAPFNNVGLSAVELNPKVVHILYRFKKMYNTYYLQFLPQEFLMFLKTKSRLNPFFQNFTPVQLRLIDNYFNLKDNPVLGHRQYEYIKGPHYLTVQKAFDTENNLRTFYVFGELHEKLNEVGQCESLGMTVTDVHLETSMSNYLKTLSQNTPQFLDIYLEFPIFGSQQTFEKVTDESSYLLQIIVKLCDYYQMNGPKNYKQVYLDIVNDPIMTAYKASKVLKFQEMKRKLKNDILIDIANTFYNCMEPSQRQQDVLCKLVRIHAIDIRSKVMDLDPTSLITKTLLMSEFYALAFEEKKFNLKEYSTEPNTDEGDLAYYHKISLVCYNAFGVDELYDLFTNSNYDTVITTFTTSSPVIVKELGKVVPIMKELILEFIAGEFQKEYSKKKIKRIFQNLLYFDENIFTLDDFIEAIKELSNFIETLLQYVMDCYCLARVFRKFKHKEGQILDQPLTPNTYIIYAGADHSKVYTNFVTYLKNTGTLFNLRVVYNHNNPSIDCLRFPPFAQL